jgi:hypothetical protein
LEGALTTDTAPESGLAVPRLAGQPGAGFLTTVGQSARRTLLQYLRTAQLLVMPIDLAAPFLFILRYILGGPSAPALRSTTSTPRSRLPRNDRILDRDKQSSSRMLSRDR